MPMLGDTYTLRRATASARLLRPVRTVVAAPDERRVLCSPEETGLRLGRRRVPLGQARIGDRLTADVDDRLAHHLPTSAVFRDHGDDNQRLKAADFEGQRALGIHESRIVAHGRR